MSDVQVSGAGDNAAQAWLQTLLLSRLEAMPEICLERPSSPRGDRVCGAADVPRMRLRLTVHPKAVHVQVAPEVGFGPEYDAYMPLSDLTHEHAGQAVAHAFDDVLGKGLQATLAMQAADTAGPEVLRCVAAGEVAAAGRHLTAPGHLALQAFAIRRVSQRRDAKAAPILRALVARAAGGDASPAARALGLQAVGSATALCDREAVLPMVALAQHQSPEFIVQLAHAIGEVGGPMAEAYLVTLASGHLDGQVRLGAAAALEGLQLRRRAGTGCERRGS